MVYNVRYSIIFKDFMSRDMLFSNEMDSIVELYLAGNSEWVKKEVSVPIPNLPDGMVVNYFYNQAKNYTIIPSPLAVTEGGG
jgi:hypothetical protein